MSGTIGGETGGMDDHERITRRGEAVRRTMFEDRERVAGRCLCGDIRLEIDYPARWAWHDHSRASRLAHGAAYATYVGSWRKRFRIVKGKTRIVRYEDKNTGTTRAFCGRCGTPLYYERARSPHMVNIPRALFQSRTGRHPLYHAAIAELQDWTYVGGTLVPLKGFPGIVWERPKRKRRAGPAAWDADATWGEASPQSAAGSKVKSSLARPTPRKA